MAFLMTEENIKLEFHITRAIVYNAFDYSLCFWKDEKPCYFSKEGCENCTPEDFINYRIVVDETEITEDFLETLKEFIDCHKKKYWEAPIIHAGDYLSFEFSMKENLVNLCIDNKQAEIPDRFNFTVIFENLIEFYNNLKDEFYENNRPYRLFINKNDISQKEIDSFKTSISMQKKIDTDKPIFLIDDSCLDKHTLKYLKMIDNEVFPVIQLREDRDFLDEESKEKIQTIKELFPTLPFIFEEEYPLNQKLILLQDTEPPFCCYSSGLNPYCCTDRDITIIWFNEYCNRSWKIIPNVIQEVIKNPPNLKTFVEPEDDEDEFD